MPKRPLWKYQDDRGIEHKGYLEAVTDDGRIYQFRDEATNELSVISGARLKDHAHKIWK